ncbi:hypothetical protein HK104_006880 [Borealophlyctis nickersoniae]|nr:hypothetical protein HK104_006880 [Borealophlyctis nickersoniae]
MVAQFEFMDGVNQRRLAALIYSGIWAVKAHHIYHLTSGDLLSYYYLGFWFILDALYFLVLKLARVPWLQFSSKATALFILAHWLIDAGIIGGWSRDHYREGASSCKAPDDLFRQLMSSGRALPADHIDGSRIIGSHTVNVRPPTLAQLNPNRTSICLNAIVPSAIIPVTIKGTPPYLIDYEVWGFDGTHIMYENVTIHGLDAISAAGKEKTGRRVERYPLKAGRTGVYRLLKIREAESHGPVGEGKVVGNALTAVVGCPEASFVIPEEDAKAGSVDRCVDNSYSFSIANSGTPPFATWYLKKIGGVENLVSLDVPDGIREAPPTFKDPIPDDVYQLLEKSQRHTATTSVNVKVETSAPYFFRLLQITDGRNNTLEYPYELEIPPPETGSNVLRADQAGDAFLVNGRPQPTARFESCDNIKVRAGIAGDTLVPITLEGNPPFKLTLKRAESEDDIAAGKFDPPLKYTDIRSSRFELAVSRPGIYVLDSVSDNYCNGSVELPFTCPVQQTYPPTINVTSVVIEEACVGAIGAIFNISMTGEPPFEVEYEMLHVDRGKAVREHRNLERGRDVLRFEPKEPGKYKYTFLKIGDANYPSVPVDNLSFTQTIHPQSNARFSGPRKQTRCVNASVDLDVVLEGSGPWRLTYEIMGEGKKRRFSVNIDKPVFSIKTPPFEIAGTYIVDLIEITDANGCSRILQSPEVHIDIVSTRPSVHFICPKPVLFLDGSVARIPLSVSGSGNFEVQYKKRGTDKIHTIRETRKIGGIEVSEPGTYEIVSVRDTHCPGNILPPQECTAVTIPKPSLEIPPTEYHEKTDGVHWRDDVCLGVPQTMEVHLSGQPPFKIKYKHGYAKDERHRVKVVDKNVVMSDYEDQSSQKFAKIKLVTDKPGLHAYFFKSITDDNYRKPIPVSKDHDVVVQQRVHAPPTAAFIDDPERIIKCIHNASDTEIRIKLTGRPPFTLQMFSKHESNPRERIERVVTEKDLSEGGIYIYRPTNAASTGRHTYFLESIRDATGCDMFLDGYSNPTPATKVSVRVADVARISALGPDSVCVGDVLTYSLQGTPPFTVRYTWNGKEMSEVQVADPMLTLYAAEAGNVTIKEVCNGLGCCHRPEVEMTNVARDLPRAIVDGGEDRIDEIREGDDSEITIEFEGVPPFTFTWTRITLDETPHRGRRHEYVPDQSVTVSDIYNPVYKLITSQEGLFRVMSVHDRYCGYPRAVQNMAAANAVLKSS